jgi:ATP-binding cassette subfamily F protein 3
MLLSPSNVLVLDEPTNHLDLQSKAILRDALQKYEGTFIVVSHDREFVDGLSNRIWDIDQHQLKVNHFGLKEYLDRKLAELDTKKVDLRTEKVQKVDAPTSAEDRNQQREHKKTLNRLENQVQKSEKKIEELESEVKNWDLRLAELDYTNVEESDKVLQAYDELKIQLEQEMKKWEELTEELLSLGS